MYISLFWWYRCNGPGRIHQLYTNINSIQLLCRKYVFPGLPQLEQRCTRLFINLDTNRFKSKHAIQRKMSERGQEEFHNASISNTAPFLSSKPECGFTKTSNLGYHKSHFRTVACVVLNSATSMRNSAQAEVRLIMVDLYDWAIGSRWKGIEGTSKAI